MCYRQWVLAPGPLYFLWKGKLALFWMPTMGCVGRGTLSKGLTSPYWQLVDKSFYWQKEGATRRNSTVWSEAHLEMGPVVVCREWSWLVWVQFTFSSRRGLFLFPWGQFSELWQLMSRLQSGHHVVNVFLRVGGSQYLQDSSQLMAQNISYSPWAGTKGPWLCLMTKLLLFGLIWRFL